MSLGGKYVFATVMCLVLPICILISCSSVLCVFMTLGMFIFVKVMSSLISVMSPLLGSKRHRLQVVELSQRLQTAMQIVSNLPAPRNGGPIYRF